MDSLNLTLEKSNPLNIIQEQEENIFIRLNCKDCEFIECNIHPCGRTIRKKEGCTRKVSEDTAAKFYHYIEEVVPF